MKAFMKNQTLSRSSNHSVRLGKCKRWDVCWSFLLRKVDSLLKHVLCICKCAFVNQIQVHSRLVNLLLCEYSNIEALHFSYYITRGMVLSKTKPLDILENAPHYAIAFKEHLMLKHLQNLLYKLYKVDCSYCSINRDHIIFLTLNHYMLTLLSVQHPTVQLNNGDLSTVDLCRSFHSTSLKQNQFLFA